MEQSDPSIVNINGIIIPAPDINEVTKTNEELYRRCHVLSEALTEKVEENMSLENTNKSLQEEIQRLKSKNKRLKTDNKKFRKKDPQKYTIETNLAALQLQLRKTQEKANGYKEIIQTFEEEILDIKFKAERRIEKEQNYEIQPNIDKLEYLDLQHKLQFIVKKLHFKELENDILKLQIQKEKQKKINYRELLSTYELSAIKTQLTPNQKQDDIKLLKIQLQKTQQDLLKYQQMALSLEESIKQYEQQIVKIGQASIDNANAEIKARQRQTEELIILRKKIRELEKDNPKIDNINAYSFVMPVKV